MTPLLQAKNHRVLPATLSGLGPRGYELSPELTLEDYVNDIGGLFEYEDLGGAVLVGHSYAGSVITAAAERVSRRVKSLVYVDGFVPQDGQATLQLLPEPVRQTLKAMAQSHGDGWRLPRSTRVRAVRRAGEAGRVAVPRAADGPRLPRRASARCGRAAAPSGTRIAITDGQAVAIKAQGYVHYTFRLPAATCSVTGRISGISGGNKDFEAYIMDDDNFVNWSAGVSGSRVHWQSGRVVVTAIDATLAGPGTFHLVISNTWSIATDKTVQAQASAQCGG